MYAYILGTVVLIKNESIILDNQGIGYEIFTPNSFRYEENTDVKVYTYHNVREDAQELFGFETFEHLDFFKKIITVKGVGPKTGLNILSKASIDDVVIAIENSDIKFLRTLPGIGPKMASQMVLDLQGKLVVSETTPKDSQAVEDVIETLKSALGYRPSEINRIKNALLKHESDDVEVLIKYALSLLNK